jgi:5-(carboxyamino)imidazole ribonucleotide mutase
MTTTNNPASPLVGVVMGSSSDWDTMQHAVQILQHFGVAHDARVVSAHRMPDDLFAYAESAAERGLQAIIAGAGGAAHLPGMLAAKTIVPVLGVPVASKHLQGVDSLHSIVQMPKGIPVATFAIGARPADLRQVKPQIDRCAIECEAEIANTQVEDRRGIKRENIVDRSAVVVEVLETAVLA